MALTPSLVLFYVAGALTLGGALIVVMGRNIVYAAFGLLASMVGVAGLFLIALAEFLALAQLLIYGGAIVIVILFALMLTRIEDFESLSDHPQWPIAAIVAIAVFGVIAATIVGTAAPEVRASQPELHRSRQRAVRRVGGRLRGGVARAARRAHRRRRHGANFGRQRLTSNVLSPLGLDTIATDCPLSLRERVRVRGNQ